MLLGPGQVPGCDMPLPGASYSLLGPEFCLVAGLGYLLSCVT